MLRSAIHKQHENLNATFTEQSDWQIPGNFGSVEQEVTNVRNNIGIIDLSNRSKLKLSGKEHLKLLQGMLSNDVLKLEVGQGVYSTLLTVKGKVMSDMRVYRNEEYAIMDLEPGMNKPIKDHLNKYKLSYRAEIEDISYDYSLFHICGPTSAGFIERLTGESTQNMDNLDFRDITMTGMRYIIFRVNRTGESGFDILVDNEHADRLWADIVKKGEDYELNPFGLDSLEVLRVEAGIPVYGKDFDDSTIPIEAGLWNALSFEKGCFIGQEVVARIKWRGRVNWHLVGLLIESEDIPDKNDPIYSGEKKVGRITSPVYSYTIRNPVALAYLRREYVEPGTGVMIRSGDKNINAKVVKTPFHNIDSTKD